MSHPPVSTRIRVADADIVDVQCVRFPASTLGEQWIRNLRAAERLFVK
jgi:hypothetical protein